MNAPRTSAINCTAIIPCRNEGHSIGRIAQELQAHVRAVYVVDDGSSDDTAARAKEAGAIVLKHPIPRGKGSALATGWDAAERAGFEWTLMLDGDGQHEPADSPTFIAEASDAARLIIGNRMDEAEKMPLVRRATNRWLSQRISRLAGREIPDSQCGFRLAHLQTLQRLGLKAQRFEVESEMCVAFARAGLPVKFIPIPVRYGQEKSKIKPLQDAWRWWRWYLRARSEIAFQSPFPILSPNTSGRK
jgi:glycosyltransferase involved in cell wall biosynthesis